MGIALLKAIVQGAAALQQRRRAKVVV